MTDLRAYIIPVGLSLEMTGAFVMATRGVLAGRFLVSLPDILIVRQGVRATELETGADSSHGLHLRLSDPVPF